MYNNFWQRERKSEVNNVKMKYDSRVAIMNEEIVSLKSQCSKYRRERESYKVSSIAKCVHVWKRERERDWKTDGEFDSLSVTRKDSVCVCVCVCVCVYVCVRVCVYVCVCVWKR